MGGAVAEPQAYGSGQEGAPVSPAGEVEPETPVEVGTTGWMATLRRTFKRAQRDRVSMMAGSVAYQGFLSLFPLVIALLGITSILRLGDSQMSHLVKGIGQALPHGASDVLAGAVKAAQHRTTGALTATIVAIVVAIWSASSGMAVLQTGLDIAYAVPENPKFVAKRIRALAMLFVMLVLGGLASVLVVFAKPLGHGLEAHVPLGGTAFSVLWTIVRWVVALGLMVLLFSFLYRAGPNRRTPGWRWLSVGGVVATAVWLLASLGLSFYDSQFGSYGKTYGAFAGVAVLLLWMYLTAAAVLLGGQLNAELEREAVRRGGETGAPPPSQGPTRPAGQVEPPERPGAPDHVPVEAQDQGSAVRA